MWPCCIAERAVAHCVTRHKAEHTSGSGVTVPVRRSGADFALRSSVRSDPEGLVLRFLPNLIKLRLSSVTYEGIGFSTWTVCSQRSLAWAAGPPRRQLRHVCVGFSLRLGAIYFALGIELWFQPMIKVVLVCGSEHSPRPEEEELDVEVRQDLS